MLFVCYGNICRSPFAAAAFLRALPATLAQRIKVDSVGFIGPGRRPPSAAIQSAKRRGLDLSAHESKVVNPQMLRNASLIVVMASEQARGIRARLESGANNVLVLGDLDPMPIEHRTIIDPWNQADSVFDESYDRIERCVRELARIVSTAAKSPT